MPGHPKCCRPVCCVNPSFTQNYVGTPTTKCMVQVADTSTTCNGAVIVSRHWVVTDRDDNSVKATSFSPVFTFDIPVGKGYRATLTVTDENGCIASVAQEPNCLPQCPCFGLAPEDVDDQVGLYPRQIQVTFPAYELCDYTTTSPQSPYRNVRCSYPGATLLMNFDSPLGFSFNSQGPTWRGVGPNPTFIGKCREDQPASPNTGCLDNFPPLNVHYVTLCASDQFGNCCKNVAINTGRITWNGPTLSGNQFCSSMHIEIPPLQQQINTFGRTLTHNAGPVIVEGVP